MPFVPVTPMVGAGQRRRNRSASETSAGTVGSPPARASTSARRAARSRGSVVGKSGVIDGEVATRSAVGPGRRRDPRPDRAPASPAGRRAPAIASRELAGRAAVVDRHARARVGQEAGQGEAAAGQPEDGHRPVAQGTGPDRVEVEAVEVDRSAASSSSSLQPVQRGQEERHAEQRGEDPDDPEADRDLLLVPAAQLEVVVDRASTGRGACRRTALK